MFWQRISWYAASFSDIFAQFRNEKSKKTALVDHHMGTQSKISIRINPLATASYNHGQKSCDTFTFVVIFSIHTWPTPPPPYKQRWTCVSRISSGFQHCAGWGKREVQQTFEKYALYVLLGQPEITENYHCPKDFCPGLKLVAKKNNAFWIKSSLLGWFSSS